MPTKTKVTKRCEYVYKTNTKKHNNGDKCNKILKNNGTTLCYSHKKQMESSKKKSSASDIFEDSPKKQMKSSKKKSSYSDIFDSSEQCSLDDSDGLTEADFIIGSCNDNAEKCKQIPKDIPVLELKNDVDEPALSMPIPGSYLFNGPQGEGKSHFVKYVFYKHRKIFKYGLVFTNTKFEHAFEYIPDKYILENYDPRALEKLMKIQSNIIDNSKTNSKIKIPEAFVIFDDCLNDESMYDLTGPLMRLSTQLRHYHISLFICCQYANMIPPVFRTNSMVAVTFMTDTKANLQSLYESYGQRFNSYDAFRKYVIDNLGDYKFIYYDKNNTKEKNLQLVYRIMKAPKDIPHFRIEF